MDRVGQLGGGLLNTVAQIEAARRGITPGGMALQRQLQQGQLGLQQAQLGNLQAAGQQDPAVRAYLVAHPEIAGAFGLGSVPGGIAAPEVLERAGYPGSAPGNVPVLPPEVATTPALQRAKLTSDIAYQQAHGGYFQTLANLMGQLGAAGPGTAPAEGGAPGGAAPGPLGGLRLTGLGPSGPSFGYPEPIQFEAGAIGPRGLIKPGDVIGNRPAVIKPSAASQQAKGQVQRIRAAIEGLKLFTQPLNSATGQPDANGIRPIDVLPSGQSSVVAGARTLLPSAVFGAPIEFSAGKGNAAAALLISGSGQRQNLVKALGDAGNLSEQEQITAERSLLPGKGDTRELAMLKTTFTTRLLENILAGIQAGQLNTPEEIKSQILGGISQSPSTSPSPPVPTTPPVGPGAGAAPPGGTGTDYHSVVQDLLQKYSTKPAPARTLGRSTPTGG